MKISHILFAFILFFISCSSENDSSSIVNDSDSNLEELKVIINGKVKTISYENFEGEQLFLQNENYFEAMDAVSGENTVYFIDGRFNDGEVMIFSDYKEFKEFMPNSESSYVSFEEFGFESNYFNSFKSSLVDKNGGDTDSRVAALAPFVSFSAGPYNRNETFYISPNSNGFFSYDNGHLRCNTGLTGGFNYSDRITSMRVRGALAVFYEGSFEGPGRSLIINSPDNRTTQISDLRRERMNKNCPFFCQNWDNEITSVSIRRDVGDISSSEALSLVRPQFGGTGGFNYRCR